MCAVPAASSDAATAELGEQLARDVEHRAPGDAGTQHHREQLGVGERGRAERQQAFARTFGCRPFANSAAFGRAMLAAVSVVGSVNFAAQVAISTEQMTGTVPDRRAMAAAPALARVVLGVTGGIAAYKVGRARRACSSRPAPPSTS